MSADQDQARLLAERIARRVSEGGGREASAPRAENKPNVSEELSVVRASLEELQQRLARIESHVTRKGEDNSQAGRAERAGPERQTAGAPSVASRSPWLSGMYVPAAAHPSQERFAVEEAAVSELVDFFEGEKKCELEPGGKPCDHCAMCNTRGF
ncbi:MAG TPA: hypothetical protein VJT09_09575 [Pyrinomonadaceae bacterium]|nr:hypothetical protein [Pyrinomonadaceae bacterium]